MKHEIQPSFDGLFCLAYILKISNERTQVQNFMKNCLFGPIYIGAEGGGFCIQYIHSMGPLISLL